MKKFLTTPILFFLFISCNKDDNPPTCTTTTATLAGTYKIIANTYKETPTSDEEDQYALKDACEKDDLLVLNSNNTYNATDAGIACSPPNDESGSWSLSGSNLTIDGEPVTIKSFDCKTLVLISMDVFVTGAQISLTLQKQ
jgi:hypothetical protein